ncbi:MAG TPA: hypothetical protein PL089_14580, partial [Ignavibacteria bacterium]|nr:hypothetical protein [Ignavibacteria bacterium]
MITYLLVDKLAKKPGWYGLPLSKSKFIRITNELKNSGVLLMPTPKIYLHAFELTYYLYNKYRKHKLIRYPLML